MVGIACKGSRNQEQKEAEAKAENDEWWRKSGQTKTEAPSSTTPHHVAAAAAETPDEAMPQQGASASASPAPHHEAAGTPPLATPPKETEEPITGLISRVNMIYWMRDDYAMAAWARTLAEQLHGVFQLNMNNLVSLHDLLSSDVSTLLQQWETTLRIVIMGSTPHLTTE